MIEEKLDALTRAVERLTAAIETGGQRSAEPPKAEQPKAEAEQPKPEPEPEQPKLTKEDVSKAAVEMMKAGKKERVVELLRMFGAERVGDVVESDYSRLLAAMQQELC